MARAEYQVLVIPYNSEHEHTEYCIFHRSDKDVQFIAGGGEEEDENIEMSAKREAYEEADIDMNSKFDVLETRSSIPASCFPEARDIWKEQCLVIPEYTFAVMIEKGIVMLSDEHVDYEWVDYDTAISRLTFDSNKTALWELDNRIKLGLIH